jgi:hypothetical protein
VSHAESERRSEASSSDLSPSEEIIIWLRRGFAFTLPLIGAMLLGLMLAKLMF